MNRKIQTALISVFHKDGLEPIVRLLHQHGVNLLSTGGTLKFIENLGIPVNAVDELTRYPEIFDGRVKTLHPAIFGGILMRQELEKDQKEAKEQNISPIDLVIVDLYPFEETVKSGASEADIIEKIDIGGISLIRAAAKNFNYTTIIASQSMYQPLQEILEKGSSISQDERRRFALHAFDISSNYDSAIFSYFSASTSEVEGEVRSLKVSQMNGKTLRYGENPHQKATYYGNLEEDFQQLCGKELSYNNLVDVEASVELLDEFSDPTTVIIKHTNACGVASSSTLLNSYLNALSADPVSAFGGIIACNREVDLATAEELHKLFFEVLIAPSFSEEAKTLLMEKKNRILMLRKDTKRPALQFKTLLSGVLAQDKDLVSEQESQLQLVTKNAPTASGIADMLYASKIAKHTKSNTIVLAKEGQLLASGVGQTSRVDALRQAIEKAKSFGFDLKGSAMASDAFFPFADCVEIANNEGIINVIQPGGSIRDKDSIAYCDEHGMCMMLTGIRHFKH